MPNTKDPQLPSLGDQAPSRDNAAPSAGPSREEEASTEGNAFHEDEASSAGVGEPGEAHSHGEGVYVPHSASNTIAKDPKLPRQFSVYLVQLEQSFSGKDGVAKLSTADSRLVTFPDLQSCARARGVSIRNLTLSSLPHRSVGSRFEWSNLR